MNATVWCLALLLAVGLGPNPVWGQQAQMPQVAPPTDSGTPVSSSPAAGPMAEWTVPDVLFAMAITVFGIAIAWALAMIAFTSMIRSREDPAAAYWQCVGGLLFGAWLAGFLGASGLFSQGLWLVNWWFWGFYLAVGVVVAVFVSRLGRQSRPAAGAQA